MHGQRNRFSNPTQLLSRIIPQLSLLCILFCIPAFGQERVNVSVDLSKAVNILTDVSLGVPAPISDGNSFDPAGLPYLRAAGVITGRQNPSRPTRARKLSISRREATSAALRFLPRN
jgi:hypothetical protein